MAKVRSYRELIAWQRAMDLADAAYELTNAFPADERFGMIEQVRRAAVSVPSNIAEGQRLGSAAGFRRHLSIAQGSLAEAETQVLLAQRRHYVPESQIESFLELAAEVGRLMYGLANALPR